MLAPLRFILNATRGYRFAPWRSPYIRWRIETYSGQRAESLSFARIAAFVWESKWEFLSYLLWTHRLEREVKSR